jgi:hypothetical protein
MSCQLWFARSVSSRGFPNNLTDFPTHFISRKQKKNFPAVKMHGRIRSRFQLLEQNKFSTFAVGCDNIFF